MLRQDPGVSAPGSFSVRKGAFRYPFLPSERFFAMMIVQTGMVSEGDSMDRKEEKTERVWEALAAWFPKNRRAMPWREDPSPYHVWISEIMLQQTRVDTARPYYERFLSSLPDVKSLAECPEERLLKLWEGLGYYSRALNLKKAALALSDRDYEIPADFDGLLKLPGIGRYTAGAVSAIAFGRPEPVVDGNVLRVMTRLNEDRGNIDDPAFRRAMEEDLRTFLRTHPADPSVFDQGLMEIGATVCVPNGAPHCESCPFRGFCEACLQGLTDEIPVRAPKKAREKADLTVLILKEEERVGLVKRPEKGLLARLTGFPAAEGRLDPEEARKYIEKMGFSVFRIERLPDKGHVFTHVEWRMTAYFAEVRRKGPEPGGTLREGEIFFLPYGKLETDAPRPAAFRKWDAELRKFFTEARN